LVLTVAAATFGLIAAGLWLFASFQRVAAKPDHLVTLEDGLQVIDVDDETGHRVDVYATAKRQTYWNGMAAVFASAAAVCQVFLLRWP
jgi:hypothetical protein